MGTMSVFSRGLDLSLSVKIAPLLPPMCPDTLLAIMDLLEGYESVTLPTHTNIPSQGLLARNLDTPETHY